jgi:E3 ubiquitin-protein ligase FANCL
MADHPRTAPVCTTDLPQALALRWDPVRSTLANVVQQFEDTLQGYQALWAVLEDIDRNTWVLEPERPTLATSIRRIALGMKTSTTSVIVGCTTHLIVFAFVALQGITVRCRW